MTRFSGRVLLPSGEVRCQVRATDGVITAIGSLGDADVVLADDEVLLPGLVDTHVHVNEPGRTEWEGFASATRAAAAGGVTTIVDMPLNSIPPTVTVDALEVKRKAATGQCFVDVGFWGGAIPGNLADLRDLHDAGVFGFKCFLVDSGVEEFPPLSLDQVGDAMASLADLGALLVVHAEDAQAIGTSGPDYASFLASRPGRSEAAAIAHVAELSEATGCRAHIVHVSSADALPLLRQVTAETCPHYLTFRAEEIGDDATQFKCCPPIREEANREALWDGLRSGAIGLVVSDHSPATADIKTTGDFGTAWGGIASLQLGLSAVWTGARERGFSLADVVRWMSAAPAALVGLSQKGAIEVGHDADLVVFAPDDSFAVAGADLHHKNPVTPYDGMTLSGVVRSTWLRGAPVDVDGDPHGRLLSR
ncbi:allantoinase AllB [Nocardioides speluncae]|uniref:allantoinase AllB n=1 Tax=Nocardioides speluncae TaxID=2670337 RepID=UPI001F0BAB70|nr:allantoinase AllB [Nocardioides speluncae]